MAFLSQLIKKPTVANNKFIQIHSVNIEVWYCFSCFQLFTERRLMDESDVKWHLLVQKDPLHWGKLVSSPVRSHWHPHQPREDTPGQVCWKMAWTQFFACLAYLQEEYGKILSRDLHANQVGIEADSGNAFPKVVAAALDVIELSLKHFLGTVGVIGKF